MTTTEIANMALGHLGVGKDIGILDTERSAEAQAVRRFYDTAMRTTLRDFSWPFATRIEALALVEEDPNDEWNYSYRYPSACVNFHRVLSGFRNDNRQSRISHKISSDDQGKLIFTDLEQAVAEYTVFIEDSSMYPSDFTLAFSYLLAFLIAPTLTNGDPFKLGPQAMEGYQMQIAKAKAQAGMEEQPDQHPESEFIRSRE